MPGSALEAIHAALQESNSSKKFVEQELWHLLTRTQVPEFTLAAEALGSKDEDKRKNLPLAISHLERAHERFRTEWASNQWTMLDNRYIRANRYDRATLCLIAISWDYLRKKDNAKRAIQLADEELLHMQNNTARDDTSFGRAAGGVMFMAALLNPNSWKSIAEEIQEDPNFFDTPDEDYFAIRRFINAQ